VAIDKDGHVLFEQAKHKEQDGTYTMRLTYLGGHAWIGIGRNKWGINHMTPGLAVIGRADAAGTTKDGEDGNVQFYELKSDAEDVSGVLPKVAASSLQNASFTQTFADDGMTPEASILTFTQDIEEMGATDETVWIFAVGLPENQWIGKHQIHGAFQLALTSGLCDGDSAATGSASVPVTIPSLSHPESEGDKSEDDASEEDEQGSSTSSNLQLLDTTHPNQNVWLAHGILLAIAWGVLAPLAIGASLLRKHITATRFGMLWFSWHFYLNIGVVLLTLIGFILAVVATQKEGNPHFRVDGSTKDVHQKAGLAIMILVVVQGMAGYFRPAAPASAAPKPTSKADDEEHAPSAPVDSTKNSADNDSSSPAKELPVLVDKADKAAMASNEQEAAPVPAVRTAWEWSHRLGGFALLGLAWYNCHSGIEWQLQNWEDSKDWTSIFWGITAGISGSIVVLYAFSSAMS